MIGPDWLTLRTWPRWLLGIYQHWAPYQAQCYVTCRHVYVGGNISVIFLHYQPAPRAKVAIPCCQERGIFLFSANRIRHRDGSEFRALAGDGGRSFIMSGLDPKSEPWLKIQFCWLFSCLRSSSTWWDEKESTETACLCRATALTLSGSRFFSALMLILCPARTFSSCLKTVCMSLLWRIERSDIPTLAANRRTYSLPARFLMSNRCELADTSIKPH